MNNLSYKEKVEAVKSRLGETPSQMIARQFEENKEFINKKNRLDDEKKKADEEAEKLRKALHEAEQEEDRVAKKEAQEASEALREARMAIQMAEREERKEREKKAREWISEKNLEARTWKSNNTMIHTGQPMSFGEKRAYNKAGIIEPSEHWFTGDWYIKSQFKGHYD
ncbi:hypothetical protein AB4304_11650 [Vibrio breoganii]